MKIEWRRVAVYAACRDQAGRFLLTRMAKGAPGEGWWAMPGGGMEWGETVSDTLVRELAEETGLSGEVGRILGTWSQWLRAEESAQGSAGHWVGIIHEVHVTGGMLRTTWEEGTTDGAAWFTPDELRAIPRLPLVDHALGLL